MNSHLRGPMLNLPKLIPTQLLHYTAKRNQQPLFCPPNEKKNLSKTTTAKLYPATKWEAMPKK